MGDVECRVVGEGSSVVLVLHGGHMRASSDAGEAFFVEQGYGVVIPSRPGYGATPLSAGPDALRFADRPASLVGEDGPPVVVGISAGAPTALHYAERHPTRALILQSALGHAGWPRPRCAWRRTSPSTRSPSGAPGR